MSFGIGIGDILMLSGLAYTLAKTLTSDRKEAPAEFQEVQNQLFAISNALKLLSATLEKSGSSDVERMVIVEEDEILGRMIENCSATLKHLDKVLGKYPELRPDSEKEQFDENTRRKWRQELKDNMKKIKWTMEGAGLDKLRQNLATHVNALNLAIAARSCIQTNRVKAQVDLTHGMLRDIHQWYLSNIKNGPKQPKPPIAVATGATELHVSSEHQPYEPDLTFFVFPDPSSETPSCLSCLKASFNPEWLRAQGSALFRCVCGSKHDLDYALLPVSLIVRLTTSRPTWKIHAFSRAYNSVVSLLISNVPSICLANFEQYMSQLALIQGLKSASTAASSMLIYTSVQEDNRGYLSVLNTMCDTVGFRQEVSSLTVTSNGLRYVVEAIDSVQMLYYMTILFPDSAEATKQENPGLLPCRSAEIVFHTTTPNSDGEDADIAQLVMQFDHLTSVDEVRSTPGVVLKGVKGRATLGNGDHHDIEHADIELTFTSREAAYSCKSSVKSLQRHVFLSYLQSQRLEEVVQFRRDIGDVMIRDMLLLDAQATIVQHPTTNEQRMIIKSRCGSKFVTMILPPVASGPHLLEESWTIPDLPAFFVDISTENTRIIEQSSGIISTVGLPRAEDTHRSLRDV